MLVGNLSRHLLTMEDAGHLKAERMARRLNMAAPDAHVTAMPFSFPPARAEDIERMGGWDVVIDCTASDAVPHAMAAFPWMIERLFVSLEGALERRNHWEKTSHSLLVGAILHILYAEEEKTLARVATFLFDPQRTFKDTLRRMMATNHLGTEDAPQVHLVVASAARELLNKSDNERSGVLSTDELPWSLSRSDGGAGHIDL